MQTVYAGLITHPVVATFFLEHMFAKNSENRLTRQGYKRKPSAPVWGQCITDR